MQTSPISQPYQSADDVANKPDISEIILSCSQDNPYKLVLPMLAHLSHQCGDRWFTWITQSKLELHQLESYAFERAKIRVVRAKNDNEARWVLWEALRNGNSSTVVADLESLTKEERKHIENATITGNSNAIILRLFNQ